MLSVIDELYMLAYINVRSFHWILLIIQVDHGRVDIMDSLDKPLEDYINLLDMLQR
jgi:Ulp1 family protease